MRRIAKIYLTFEGARRIREGARQAQRPRGALQRRLASGALKWPALEEGSLRQLATSIWELPCIIMLVVARVGRAHQEA